MKILWASPLPPIRSGVSDYAVDLLDALRVQAHVRVVAPPDWEPPEDWSLGDDVQIVDTSTPPESAEVQLLHLGNNPYHEWLLGRIKMPRTVVVLHDLVLHHLLVEATLARDRPEMFQEQLAEAHPAAADALHRARQVGVTGHWDPFLFPSRRAFLSEVTGVLVHSRWGLDRVTRDLPEVPVRRIPLAVVDPGPVDRLEERHRSGVDTSSVLLAHIGFLTPEKGMRVVLAAVAAALRAGIPVRLLIVGEGGERSRLDRAIGQLGLDDHVSFTGWVTDRQLRNVPAAADLGVALRTPSAGETSAAAVRFLACGTPVAVSGLHQFLEWPESAAPRVTPGPSAASDLTRLLALAAAGGDGWQLRRSAARAAYLANHLPSAAASQMVEVLGELVP